jgi:hypothetical protein
MVLMRLFRKFTNADIHKKIVVDLERLRDAARLRLQRVGETFVTGARNNANFTDRTGNLRSSIGYIILENGVQYADGGFTRIKQGGEGIKKGKDFIDKISAKYPRGLVLICVAGMNYAAYVEAKGYDVITGSSQIAKDELKRAFERLGLKTAA